MTETEWQACADLYDMRFFLHHKVSDRKWRLFACACFLRIASWLRDQPIRDALAVALQFADGRAADQQRSDSRRRMQQAAQTREVTRHPDAPKWQRRAASAVYYALARDARDAACHTPPLVVQAMERRQHKFDIDLALEKDYQIRALRDIVGNPVAPSNVEAVWKTSTVKAVAEAIYADRAFDRLPILADALEDAGCTDAAILDHCRQPGEHVRGCWVVDLVLGKE